MEKAGDLGPAGALGSEDPDGVLFPGEFHLFGQGSLGAAQMDPLGLLSGRNIQDTKPSGSSSSACRNATFCAA